MTQSRWAVVTRYVRPKDGRVVRHIYFDDDSGLPYSTRARALGAVRRLIRENREYYPDIDQRLEDGSLEVNAVKIVDIPSD